MMVLGKTETCYEKIRITQIRMNNYFMIIDRTAQQMAYAHISARRKRPWKGEEEVRVAWVSALEAALNVHFDAERAKKDSSYNNVIIEFKAPGFFKGCKSSAKFKEAIEQRLLPYIRREAIKVGIPAEDFIGIAIDGDHVCFAQVLDDTIHTQHLIPFSEYAVGLVIQAIKADTRRAISVDNLLADFGHASNNAQALMQAMAVLCTAKLPICRFFKPTPSTSKWGFRGTASRSRRCRGVSSSSIPTTR